MCFLKESILRDFSLFSWSASLSHRLSWCQPCSRWWISRCCWSSSTWMFCLEVLSWRRSLWWSPSTPRSCSDSPWTFGSISTWVMGVQKIWKLTWNFNLNPLKWRSYRRNWNVQNYAFRKWWIFTCYTAENHTITQTWEEWKMFLSAWVSCQIISAKRMKLRPKSIQKSSHIGENISERKFSVFFMTYHTFWQKLSLFLTP